MAHLLSLLPTTIDPHTEAHENDPAGSSDASNESWLLNYTRDLLSKAHTIPIVHRDSILVW